MLNFNYCNPTKIIFGKDTIKNLGSNLKLFNIKNVLLLYGQGSIFKNGVYNEAVNSLKDNNINFVELSGVKPNPRLSKVKEGIKVIKENALQGIIAIGGGSVIDSAKAISAGSCYEGDVWELFEKKGTIKKALPIFTILTISATGSEMNSGGVITNEAEGKKWAFGSPLLYPKISILDPSIQSSLPNIQTANGCADAISHVLELYLDGTKNTDILDEISLGIIKTLIKHTKILLKDSHNYDSRCEFVWSATLALNGINGTGRVGDWASHQIEHSLSVLNDISHGSGLSIIMPAWMEYLKQNCLDKLVKLGENVFDIKDGTDIERANKAILALKDFYKEIGLPTSLRDANVKKEDLSFIAENASMLSPLGSLKKLYKDDIYNILNISY